MGSTGQPLVPVMRQPVLGMPIQPAGLATEAPEVRSAGEGEESPHRLPGNTVYSAVGVPCLRLSLLLLFHSSQEVDHDADPSIISHSGISQENNFR
jgi:hypothetical protein